MLSCMLTIPEEHGCSCSLLCEFLQQFSFMGLCILKSCYYLSFLHRCVKLLFIGSCLCTFKQLPPLSLGKTIALWRPVSQG